MCSTVPYAPQAIHSIGALCFHLVHRIVCPCQSMARAISPVMAVSQHAVCVGKSIPVPAWSQASPLCIQNYRCYCRGHHLTSVICHFSSLSVQSN